MALVEHHYRPGIWAVINWIFGMCDTALAKIKRALGADSRGVITIPVAILISWMCFKAITWFTPILKPLEPKPEDWQIVCPSEMAELEVDPNAGE